MSATTVTTGAAEAAAAVRPKRETPAPIPFTRVFEVELRKMFDTRAGFWLMASIAILSIGASVAVAIFAPDDDLTYEAFGSAVGIPMSIVLPMLGVLTISSEWSQRNALTTFALVPHRGRVIAAKALVTIAVGIAGMLVALAVGALGNVLGNAVNGTDPTWDISVPEFSKIVLAMLIGMAMGFVLGLLFRSSPAGIVGYFVYGFVLFGISQALAAANTWWYDNAPWLDLNWAMGRLYEGDMTGEHWAQLGVTSVLWLLIPLAIGLRLAMRAEVK